LWSPDSTAALNAAELTNHDFLEALRHLAFTRQGKVLRPVDYKNLGAEELGGVYESLLALTPQISADGARFTFAEFAGNERKTSGSYYTPDSLVQCLLDSALDPVVADAIMGKTGAEAEQAILNLKICDPAVGSGHFLVGAAHRLARHLARVRAQAQGESEPSPLRYQQALRDVIGRCLYGVDVNPMAAELCRVSLWLEALEPGKPLSFLDHHIRVGNSLLGTTPELIAGGLPDEAFSPIEGDDNTICTALRRRNRQERDGGQTTLDLRRVAEPSAEYDTLASRSQGIDQAPDDSLAAIARKAEQFHRLVVSPEYRHRQTVADAWCAAFVWPKRTPAPAEPITTDTIRRLETDAAALSPAQRAELERLARRYQFFHWHLAFPEVFARGGFDVVLGNPPWERVKLQEQEFFASREPAIANARNAAERRQRIAALPTTNPDLWRQWSEATRIAQGQSHFVRESGRYPLCGKGDVNTYALFAEHNWRMLAPRGRAGFIVPSGIATDDTTKEYFQAIMRERALHSMWEFENEGFFTAGKGHMLRFALTVLSGRDDPPITADFLFQGQAVSDLADRERHFTLSAGDIEAVNPNTGTCPIFRTRRDASIALQLYRRAGVLWREDDPDGNPWGLRFMAMFHMANDSGLFRTQAELASAGWTREGNRFVKDGQVMLPLYEAKMTYQYNHRSGTFEGAPPGERLHRLPSPSDEQLADPCYAPMPFYWVAQEDVDARLDGVWDRGWLLGWRDVTDARASVRTVVACVIPRAAVGHKLPLLMPSVAPPLVACLSACLSSFVLDYAARQKVGGISLTYFILKQLPVLAPAAYLAPAPWEQGALVRDWILPRVLELAYTAWDLEPFARDCGWDGPPFRWDEERRFLIRCELDAAFLHLYLPADANGGWRPARRADGCPHDETPEQLAELKQHFPTPRDAVAYILDTFPIVRRKDEETYGEYRTRRVILEIYDAMLEAIRTGRPYQTRLNPPPGPPCDADGKFVPYAQIAHDPPPHMHLPRGAATGGDLTLHLSDLAVRFPTSPFRLRLGVGGAGPVLRVRPVRTADIQPADRVALASPKLRRAGTPVAAAIGSLRTDSRTDASDGSAYVWVTVRGEDGTAQARFAEHEWHGLTTIGVVEDDAGN
jgi:hypothetical protein